MVQVPREDHRDREQGESDDEEVRLRIELDTEKVGPRNVQDAVWATCVVPVVESDPGHLTETKGDDREVVAAQAKCKITENNSSCSSEQHGQRQRGKKVPVRLSHQKRAGVGADRK